MLQCQILIPNTHLNKALFTIIIHEQLVLLPAAARYPVQAAATNDVFLDPPLIVCFPGTGNNRCTAGPATIIITPSVP